MPNNASPWINQRGRPPGASWHEGLQCCVIAIGYEPASRRGVLCMPDGSCCDMSGCIVVFEAIDPMVAKIETWAGDRPDMAYVKLPGGGWSSHDRRVKSILGSIADLIEADGHDRLKLTHPLQFSSPHLRIFRT
jgi:hypothetical protein